MFGSAYQTTVISLIVATVVYFVLNAIWTVYNGLALFAEIAVAVILGPLFTYGSVRLYRLLFRR
jgi:hypothetical protein